MKTRLEALSNVQRNTDMENEIRDLDRTNNELKL